jgi:uncharacterized membrane protein YGL010W
MNFAKEIRKIYREELLFYSKYHQNKTNWMIHAVTIPIEWITWFMILCYFNIELVTATIISAYYLMVQTKMSIPSALSQFLIAFMARYLCDCMSMNAIIYSILLIQAFSWFVQVFIGHRIFEGNLPAMTKKLSFNSVILSMLLSWDY